MEKGETPLANFWMVLEVTVCIISQAYHSIPTFASYFLLFSLLRVEYTAKLDLQAQWQPFNMRMAASTGYHVN